jgi:glutamine synthetase
MFKTFSDAAEYVERNSIRMIDLKFSDLWGKWHHVTISAREFTPNLLKSGVGFDGSSVGLKSVKSGDMVLVPDLETGFSDPFYEIPTLSFICKTLEADTKEPFSCDPREILRRANQFMIDSHIADESLWGPEFEFYIFNKAYFENSVNSAGYHFDCDEANWNNAEDGHGYYIPLHGGYHAIPPNDRLFQLRNLMAATLEDMGIPVKYHHHEVGGPGQTEIETPMMDSKAAADSILLIKYVTKMIAHQNGQTVTYLPKPLYGEAGSGMHFHQQLFKNGKNVFYDADGPNLLSETALYYIGGLLKHAPAVLAFTNPTTNSYRRLVPGFEAPVKSFFSSGNRSAAIRVPKYATQPDSVRFEFRPPDATCNPYFAMASMLMAGLDGIINKIDPTEAGFGPINENIFEWSEEKRATIRGLPTSLDEAIQALETDHDFLTASNVFDEFMIADWIKAKKAELFQIQSRPHPFEIEKYFDF